MSDLTSNEIKQRWTYLDSMIAGVESEFVNQFMDDELAKSAMEAMQEKLKIARSKGREGWYRENCNTDDLKDMLKEHVDKGDMRDVMNIAAMIYYRESAGIGEKESE